MTICQVVFGHVTRVHSNPPKTKMWKHHPRIQVKDLSSSKKPLPFPEVSDHQSKETAKMAKMAEAKAFAEGCFFFSENRIDVGCVGLMGNCGSIQI